jgi:hypothetical protein
MFILLYIIQYVILFIGLVVIAMNTLAGTLLISLSLITMFIKYAFFWRE